MEIFGIWNDLQVHPHSLSEESLPVLINKGIAQDSRLDELKHTISHKQEKAIGLSGKITTEQIENDEPAQNQEQASYHRHQQLSQQEQARHCHVADQLSSISRFLDDVSFASTHVAMSPARFAQVHELDVYEENANDILGYPILWKTLMINR